MTSERFTIGQEMLQRVDGKGGDAVVNSLKDIAPDFARYLIEFPFGDIYARQLKVHIAAGLNVGLTQEEMTEVIMQMAVYAGFPAALNGLFAAKEVFAAQRSAGRTNRPA